MEAKAIGCGVRRSLECKSSGGVNTYVFNLERRRLDDCSVGDIDNVTSEVASSVGARNYGVVKADLHDLCLVGRVDSERKRSTFALLVSRFLIKNPRSRSAQR